MGLYENINGQYRNADEIYVGLSAYEIAVKYGYEGTEEQWLASLKNVNVVSVTVPITGWSNTAPYTITLPCIGVANTDMIMWDVDIPVEASASDVTDILASYALIDKIAAGTNTVTLYCWSGVPTTEITLNMAVIKE